MPKNLSKRDIFEDEDPESVLITTLPDMEDRDLIDRPNGQEPIKNDGTGPYNFITMEG